jgi:hypothetical protein
MKRNLLSSNRKVVWEHNLDPGDLGMRGFTEEIAWTQVLGAKW